MIAIKAVKYFQLQRDLALLKGTLAQAIDTCTHHAHHARACTHLARTLHAPCMHLARTLHAPCMHHARTLDVLACTKRAISDLPGSLSTPGHHRPVGLRCAAAGHPPRLRHYGLQHLRLPGHVVQGPRQLVRHATPHSEPQPQPYTRPRPRRRSPDPTPPFPAANLESLALTLCVSLAPGTLFLILLGEFDFDEMAEVSWPSNPNPHPHPHPNPNPSPSPHPHPHQVHGCLLPFARTAFPGLPTRWGAVAWLGSGVGVGLG